MIAAIGILSLLCLQAALLARFTVINASRIEDMAVCADTAFSTLDFCAAQIKIANAFSLSRGANGSLKELNLFTQTTPGAAEHNYVITYSENLALMQFGGRSTGTFGVGELASNVVECRFFADTDAGVMFISLTAGENESVFTASTAVDIHFKEKR